MPLSAAHEFPIWVNGLIFLAAGVVVWVIGSRLTRDLDVIRQKAGLGQAFVGMLLLGGITSVPELANTITSSLIGNPALSINNLLGSAAINVLLLAAGHAFIGKDALTSAVAKPSTLMMATLCILVLVPSPLPSRSATCWFSVSEPGRARMYVQHAAFWLAVDYGHRGAWFRSWAASCLKRKRRCSGKGRGRQS